jgi:hypothetical protein
LADFCAAPLLQVQHLSANCNMAATAAFANRIQRRAPSAKAFWMKELCEALIGGFLLGVLVMAPALLAIWQEHRSSPNSCRQHLDARRQRVGVVRDDRVELGDQRPQLLVGEHGIRGLFLTLLLWLLLWRGRWRAQVFAG